MSNDKDPESHAENHVGVSVGVTLFSEADKRDMRLRSLIAETLDSTGVPAS